MAEGISAKIIAHSKSSITGKEIVTFELEYPRFIHGELMTHRLFSRNAASSRAIPVSKIIEQVEKSPAMPVHWGKNQSGMQAKEELEPVHKSTAKYLWLKAAKAAAGYALGLSNIKAHKQVVNRILEPFQTMKTVLTATEFDNFFWLRNHEDAQPEIKRLAELMLEAIESSRSVLLEPSEWHVPYVGFDVISRGYFVEADGGFQKWLTVEEALAISASCCAQVSYRRLDDSLEKAQDIFAKLIESKPCHASPCEHQATPMDYPDAVDTTELRIIEGATHIDKDGCVWSGNFKGFIQHRQLIPDNVCNNYKESL